MSGGPSTGPGRDVPTAPSNRDVPALGAAAVDWRSLSPILGRVSRGLIAYGIVGLVLSLVAAIAVGLAIGRLSGLGDAVGGGAGDLGAVLDRTASVLDDASTSAAGFGSTIDSGSAALTSAAVDIRAIVPRLRDVEGQANAISILGSQPLAPLAGLFGQIADQLGDLDGRLDTVTTNLTENRAALTANAASLKALADETRALAARLAPDILARAVDDARWFAIALLVVVLAGVTLPAVAALAFAWWLRRELLRVSVRPGSTSGPAPAGPPPAGPTPAGPTPA
jgi:hypothetical protein